jgi:hypothetical protein
VRQHRRAFCATTAPVRALTSASLSRRESRVHAVSTRHEKGIGPTAHLQIIANLQGVVYARQMARDIGPARTICKKFVLCTMICAYLRVPHYLPFIIMTIKRPGQSTGNKGGIFQEVGPKGGKQPNYVTVPDNKQLPPTTKPGHGWTSVTTTPNSKR